jgi:succinate dehydrogenase / fumarate reductase cytochrome b subunit
MLLFLALPFLLLMLQNSLRSDTTFHDLSVVVSNPLVKICLLGVMWGFLHHFCAGLRYLAIDLHYVRNLAQARGSSMAVVIVSLALTIIFGVKLW